VPTCTLPLLYPGNLQQAQSTCIALLFKFIFLAPVVSNCVTILCFSCRSRSSLRLDDFENSCAAYEKAVELGADHLTHLNYAITLYRNDEIERAKNHFDMFQGLYEQVLAEGQDVDPDIGVQAEMLKSAMDQA